MMLGTMEYDTGRFGDKSRYTICVNHKENFNIYESLSSAIGKLDATVTDFEIEEPEENEEIIEANPDVRNFTYTFRR